MVILKNNDGSKSSEILVAVGIGGVVKAAATGHGGTVTDSNIFWSRWILMGIDDTREEIVC